MACAFQESFELGGNKPGHFFRAGFRQMNLSIGSMNLNYFKPFQALYRTT
jgi:hypothetical protein